ncbi:hypothetical protein [Candidatus Viridilinea mediisalina]|uniref:Uncharacterized protein n=1 Tax=Candidatus Viridilinea mediisalina TaxID=2024553 RepID=A0A2A6RP20_9CHLR|nr:hypothetical protein [Candidatus Viridilinea mediisalina]PDW04641.1 hypothetical protein CJ255_02370 [Candidatus Viridilinea mediisalina]
MTTEQSKLRFVICIENSAYPAALERRKLYQVIPDDHAASHHLIRVIDESGEDYVYPEAYFIPVDFAPSIQEALLRAA